MARPDPFAKECQCLDSIHSGPHWLHMDAIWREQNVRDLIDPACAMEQLHNLRLKAWHGLLPNEMRYTKSTVEMMIGRFAEFERNRLRDKRLTIERLGITAIPKELADRAWAEVWSRRKPPKEPEAPTPISKELVDRYNTAQALVDGLKPGSKQWKNACAERDAIGIEVKRAMGLLPPLPAAPVPPMNEEPAPRPKLSPDELRSAIRSTGMAIDLATSDAEKTRLQKELLALDRESRRPPARQGELFGAPTGA